MEVWDIENILKDSLDSFAFGEHPDMDMACACGQG